eukprot:6467018-Amphidinium_carterae.1
MRMLTTCPAERIETLSSIKASFAYAFCSGLGGANSAGYKPPTYCGGGDHRMKIAERLADVEK